MILAALPNATTRSLAKTLIAIIHFADPGAEQGRCLRAIAGGSRRLSAKAPDTIGNRQTNDSHVNDEPEDKIVPFVWTLCVES